jgi:NAD(P)H dehydrogenase (quinone)
MTIAVTGATGVLGRLVVQELLDRGTAPGGLVALARDPARAGDLAERGVQVRLGDYDRPDTLAPALAGVDTLLLVSGNEVGRRLPQHRAVVDAAVAAGVRRLAYTSITRADSTPMLLAGEHRETEELVRGSGLAYTLLRNSWYLENYTSQVPTYLRQGTIVGSAGDGRVSAATRRDYAAAAAAVLVEGGHEGRVYELGGDQAFTMTELAAEVSRCADRDIDYRDLPVDDYAALLASLGIPEQVAAVLADSDAGVGRGDLYVDTGDLARLAGRPTTPWRDVVAAAVRAENGTGTAGQAAAGQAEPPAPPE